MDPASKPGSVVVETWSPSEISRISPLVDNIARLIQLTRCVPGQELDVEIALREALSNAVQHGNRCDPQKLVFLTCYFEFGKGITLVVRDEGQGFDPRVVPDALSPEVMLCEHGRGIHLMKFYMDEVSFDNGGTEVRMTKKAAPRRDISPQSARAVLQALLPQ